MRTLALTAIALFTAAGCTNASIAEAYGRPDPFEWTYFEGSTSDVVDALVETFAQSGVRVESVRNEDDGMILTLSSRLGSADYTEIYVEATDVESFTARAQIYPDRDPLPRWLEAQVSARM